MEDKLAEIAQREGRNVNELKQLMKDNSLVQQEMEVRSSAPARLQLLKLLLTTTKFCSPAFSNYCLPKHFKVSLRPCWHPNEKWTTISRNES